MGRRTTCPNCGMSMVREYAVRRITNRSHGRSEKVRVDTGHAKCSKCGTRDLVR